MSAKTAEHTFANYEHDDDVRELAVNLLGELADGVGVDITGERPDPAKLGALVGGLGVRGEAQLDRFSDEVWPVEKAAALVVRSGAYEPLDRALWTPARQMPSNATGIIIGASADQQDRATELVVGGRNPLYQYLGGVIVATGSRVMNTPADMANTHIQEFFEAHEGCPTESEYAEHFVVKRIKDSGLAVAHRKFDAEDELEFVDQLIEADFRDKDFSFTLGNMAALQVAGAGVQTACRIRRAVGRIDPNTSAVGFDRQLYIITDGSKIASTEDELSKPGFQNPYEALQQIALTGQLLTEAQAA